MMSQMAIGYQQRRNITNYTQLDFVTDHMTKDQGNNHEEFGKIWTHIHVLYSTVCTAYQV